MADKENSLSSIRERHVLQILGVISPLDAPDLDPTDLASVDTVLDKIQRKKNEMGLEAERLTAIQSDGDNHGAGEVEKAKKTIQSLFEKIQDIKSKATQSEAMVQEITQDVKSLDYAKRHLIHSVTALKRLQMLVTAVDQLEMISRNKQYKESAQLLQAVIQLMHHFKSYKSVPQIAHLSDRITKLQKDLERAVLEEFDQGRRIIGGSILAIARCLPRRYCPWGIYKRKVRQEISQLENISRRYAWLKRMLKTCDENHAAIFPSSWRISCRLCEEFCITTKSDMEQVLASIEHLDVVDLLKAFQLTIEFETQLTKRYERALEGVERRFHFERSISASFHPYLWVYIDAEDKTLTNMIVSYVESDRQVDEDASAVVLPSSTDLFYFYRETLVQCAKFSTGGAFWDLCQLFAKHLHSYCDVVLLGGVVRHEKTPVTTESLRYISLALNTADYCCITTSQLEEKLKEKIDEGFKGNVDLQNVRDAFMSAVSYCIDAAVRALESSCEGQFQQMTRLPWSTLEIVGDQSEYVTQLQEIVKQHTTTIGRAIASRRYFRTFCDRFVECFLSNYLLYIFRSKPISEIGAEQMLLDTHAIKTLLMEIPQVGTEGTGVVPASAELILKTVMTPTDPIEGHVENYLFLIGDRHVGNYSRLLELKGIKKPEQGPWIDAFQRRIITYSGELSNNSNVLPNPESTAHMTTALPSAISSSLSTIATSASNFNPNSLQQFGRSVQASPTTHSMTPLSDSLPSSSGGGGRTTGRLNENFRKLVMTGMAFRKDLQERREHQQQNKS
ncbi:Vps53-like protein [Dichotomocladium elegans]|nr:Vps53-like protein [Dichotomocladium elegans]